MRLRTALLVVALVTALLAVAPPSSAQDTASVGSPDLPGVYRGDIALLRSSNTSGPADALFSYGDPGDVPLVGDWNGDGIDTLGIRRGNAFYLRNSNTGGPADLTFAYGRAGDTVVTGDWNGNGIDTIGIRRGNAYFLRNTNTTGPADIVIGYGSATDTPVVGDWNGNGQDTFGVRRGNAFYLRNSLSTGVADIVLGYGTAADTPVVGDWNGNGIDTFGVRRGNQYLLRNTNTSGPADVSFAFGNGGADELPITGRWGPVRSPSPTADPLIRVSVVADGLSIPWGLDIAPDGVVVVAERAGTISVVVGGVRRALVADMSDLFRGSETGLMGLELDPGFATNRRFYTCQGHVGPQIQVIAWTVDSAWTTATRVTDPLVAGLPVSTGRHGGCRLEFDQGGQLLVGTGDAAVGSLPQNLASLGGKVLRVDPTTGQGSAGNPFAGSANADTRRILTFGHRNVQGLAVRPTDGRAFSIEHGSFRDDEINLLVPGGNYGWSPVPGYNESVPMTDFGRFPNAIGAVWTSGPTTLATSGGAFIDGEEWGAFDGALAVASLKNSTLRLFFFDGAGRLTRQVVVAELNGTYGRLRSVELGPDRALYVTTANGSNDKILRVSPA